MVKLVTDILVINGNIVKITHSRYLTEEEMVRFSGLSLEPEEPAANAESDPVEEVGTAEAPQAETVKEAPSQAAPPELEKAPEEIKKVPEQSEKSTESVPAEPVKVSPADADGDTPLLGDVPPDPVKEKDAVKSAVKNVRKSEEKSPDGEDDLGIIQPEFGF